MHKYLEFGKIFSNYKFAMEYYDLLQRDVFILSLKNVDLEKLYKKLKEFVQ